MIKCIKVCEQGFSHKAQNKVCQDFSNWITIVEEERICSIIAVADGHGGDKYFRSDKGSKLAVKVAQNQLMNFALNIDDFFESDETHQKESIKNLEARIISEWCEKVKLDFQMNQLNEKEKDICKDFQNDSKGQEYDENQLSDEEKKNRQDEINRTFYGTTLLAALYIPAKPFWCAIQIGDGLVFALDASNEGFCPVPEDESLGFGYTTSLCSKNAADNFRHNYKFSKLNALTLCSDGVADSFEKDKFGAFIKKIQENIRSNSVRKELRDFFPELSEQGSGDDVSFAGVFEYKQKKG